MAETWYFFCNLGDKPQRAWFWSASVALRVRQNRFSLTANALYSQRYASLHQNITPGVLDNLQKQLGLIHNAGHHVVLTYHWFLRKPGRPFLDQPIFLYIQ